MKTVRNEVGHIYGLKYFATKAKYPNGNPKKENVTLTFEGKRWARPGAKAAELKIESVNLDTQWRIKTSNGKVIKLDCCEAEEVLLVLIEQARQSKTKYFRGKKRYL